MAARAAGETAEDVLVDDTLFLLDNESLPDEPADKEAGCYLTRGPGDTHATRWRISLTARQAITGYFDPACVPAGLPNCYFSQYMI